MSKQKRIFILMIISLVALAVFLSAGLILGFNNAFKSFIANFIFTIVLLVITVLALVLLNMYISEKNLVRDSIKENEYNLHRTYRFYNYDAFAKELNRHYAKLHKYGGYLIAFTAIKTKIATSYPFAQVADFAGCIADHLREKFDDKGNKRYTYC